ncbi:MAG: tol-pal system protein YbgF [Desulfobacteraceae bacterium]|nr:MAG: tol-pal system protein YbgF [Desulfobacteraceae bacterium]
MKRFALISGFLALLPIVGFSSCAYDKDMAYLNDQVIALNRRVAKIEEAMDSKISTIRTNQGDVRVEIDQMRGEMQKLQGRLEDNERIVKRSVERDLSEQDALKKKVAELEPMVRAHQEYLGMSQAGTAPVERQPGQVAAVPTAPPPPPKPKDVELYDNSLALYKAGKFEDSIQGFRDFLKKYPKSDNADNAQFWIGESYFSLRQYEQAILAYNDVIKHYPKGNKVPNALLRQSLAFLEINDKTSARLLLRKLIKEYPNSPEAKIASKKMESLKN